MMNIFYVFNILFAVIPWSECQREPSSPLKADSIRQIARGILGGPKDRKQSVDGIIIRHFPFNFSMPTSWSIRDIKLLAEDPRFNLSEPTVLYAHGFAELWTDRSVNTIVNSYLKISSYNILIVDWSNLAFGNYLFIATRIPAAGTEIGKAMLKLLKRGLRLQDLHFIGHSMGAHLIGQTARYLMSKGYQVPRLTGLDPAYPLFYPSLVPPMAPSLRPTDAFFVDTIHTDGGGFGAPGFIGHADFWPNEGQAKQPGCVSGAIFLTADDFCSHWRSWEFWAESVTGGEFLARRCSGYDSLLRGTCLNEPTVHMGLRATSDLRGNFYLRTAAKPPYALGERGAC